MTNFYLANSNYVLPFPFASRQAAERHAANLGGGFTVIERQPVAVNESDYEAACEDAVIERAEALAGERWTSDSWDS